ncbi:MULTISPECIES: thiamine-phosphate kinase [Luteimonas]|uniref:thiamine-phosphate kinase n=1 Tax=Luteimonas TaxID=83614 RepID=UPI000C7E4C12|nr:MULTISPECIES: thiamine-phosphate kinase [Luteimonas]
MSAGAGEFDLIGRIRARVAGRDDVVLGIGDDAAIVQVPRDRQLVIAMDTLNAGVHFPGDTAPADIGWKALAVNLSDLAAMAATPAWCTLSLSLPDSDAAWLDGFLDGFAALAAAQRVALVGGDTTRGPLSVCVTVHGLVAPDAALRRDAARVGDDIWISGTLGDAAAALRQWQAGGVRDPALRARLDRPTPRVALGLQLAGLAHAAIDVSDGLLADLGHVCVASHVGAELRLADLPASPTLRAACDPVMRASLQATGGDDYELCFTAPPQLRDRILQAAETAATPVTRIGVIGAGQSVSVRDGDGAPWRPARTGFDHFDAR